MRLMSGRPSTSGPVSAFVPQLSEFSVLFFGPTLWLVMDEGRAEHLAGMLLPFELM